MIFSITRHWLKAVEVVDHEFSNRVSGREISSAPPAVYVENDSYYWLGYTQDVMDGGDWRAHHTLRDDPPGGRPVHWAFFYLGLLLIAGKVTVACTGLPPGQALELGVCWVNPIMHALLLLLGVGVLWRRVGAIAAIVLALTLATAGDMIWTFHALRPDHQSLHALFAFATVLLLAAGGLGWVEPPKMEGASMEKPGFLRAPEWMGACGCMAAAGVAGGLGLWVSAAVQGMVIVAVFFAVLGLAWFSPSGLSSGRGRTYRAELWRVWGWTGAGVGLVCYGFEYWPHEMGMRLEVNHPFYELAWMAMAEILYRLTNWRFNRVSPGGKGWLWVAVCAVVVVSLPALIVFGPTGIHALRDGYMARLHNFIGEFYSYPVFLKSDMGPAFLKNYAVFSLSLVFALYLADVRRSTLLEWSVLWFVFALSFFFLLMAYMQVRWIAVYVPLQGLLVALVVGFAWLRRGQPKQKLRLGLGIAYAALLVVQAGVTHVLQTKELDRVIAKKTLPQELSGPAMRKQLALGIKQLRAGRDWRFLSDPDYAPALQYFAGVPCVTSFYWENVDGLHAAADFLSDEGGWEALRIAVKRGLTHVLVPQGNRLSNYFYYIQKGNYDMQRAALTIAGKMDTGRNALPSWIRMDIDMQLLANQDFVYGNMVMGTAMSAFVLDTKNR
jgi:hypothetical protein